MGFKENLASLESVDLLEKATVTDSSGKVYDIPNVPGKSGSLAVYADTLGFRSGTINSTNVGNALRLFAEYLDLAMAHPGDHPNIDRLLEIRADNRKSLGVELVYASSKIQSNIGLFGTLSKDERLERNKEVKRNVRGLINLLESGRVRSAEKVEGTWRANSWVKQGILFGFEASNIIDMSYGGVIFRDKELYPAINPSKVNGVRVVPGGTSIRTGAYLSKGVVIMPPTYVNVGAYVDSGTMLDSHSLVGSCAQVGKNVHISAGAIVGGVLEPVNAVPCVVEDSVVMGINSSISEGTVLGKRAVLAPGVNLTKSIPVYDRVNGRYIEKVDGRTYISEGAVVVLGSKKLSDTIFQNIGIITKYRDDKTDAAVALEEALR